jgi:hypothetical protein
LRVVSTFADGFKEWAEDEGEEMGWRYLYIYIACLRQEVASIPR